MPEVPDVADYGWPKQDEYEVRLKHAGGHSSIFYRNDPMKIVGWEGDLFPFKLNVRNILPIMSDRQFPAHAARYPARRQRGVPCGISGPPRTRHAPHKH
jgi:hypothetical protein